MEKIQLVNQEENNLRIVEHLDLQSLPEPLQQMLSMAATPEEQDILLMATLTAASACVPNLYFRYGPTGKKYFANLQCFILAAWFNALEEQNGCGYMHESEGSVITDIWRSSAANYNTALRKAAEHEPVSRNRCYGSAEIGCPRLSMLLTGTYNQYRHLVPSVENGYFSRLLALCIRETHPFNRCYVSAKATQSSIPQQVGRQLIRLYEYLLSAGYHEWSLTDAQKNRLGEHLETEYATLISLLGENFHSAVVRIAVQIERIAMVLSALRIQSIDRFADRVQTEWVCADEDYEAAEVIGNKLLQHMAAAYRMIEGDKQELVPEIKPLDQRRVLFDQLPEEFAHKKLVEEAKAQGVPQSTVLRWSSQWIEQGLIRRISHGQYRKVA